MLKPELKKWLDRNAHYMVYDDLTEYSSDNDKKLSDSLPSGWSLNEKAVAHQGGEDQGSTYFTIWEFTNGDEKVLIRVNGYYQSYNGADYMDYDEVALVTKTIQVYDKV